jgi:hypothetical protein
MYRRALLLTWGLAFIAAELAGLGTAYLAWLHGVAASLTGSIADIVIVALRFSLLTYISRRIGVVLTNAVYKPPPTGKRSPLVLILLVGFVGLVDYYITVSTSGGTYEPQLLGYSYYVEQGVVWAFPLKLAYYLSEITVMNYMYILAGMAWRFSKPPITAGMIFLIFGWAALHLFTKSLLVAAYAAFLVITFYLGYEYTNSPITPILLWLTVLIV